MSLSKPCDCVKAPRLTTKELYAQCKFTANLPMIWTGETKKQIERIAEEESRKSGLKFADPVTIALVAAGLIAGAFIVGGAVGGLINGMSSKKITNEITQIVKSSYESTMETCIKNDTRVRGINTNKIEIIQGGSGDCNIKHGQSINQDLAAFSLIDAKLSNEFIIKSIEKFQNDMKSKFKEVTDPIQTIANSIGKSTLEVSNKLHQEFHTAVKNIFKNVFQNEIKIEIINGNELKVTCMGSGNVNITSSQDIYNKVLIEQVQKIVADNISNVYRSLDVENKQDTSYDSFSTGFIIAIFAILIIAVFIYLYLKSFA